MIRINYKGGLGNKMFMYAAAYVLSKKHKLIVATKLDEFPCKINNDVVARSFNTETIVNNNNFISIYNNNHIDSNLVLSDFFQTKEIISLFQNEFRECFELNLTSIDGAIIHYRLGDLLSFKDKNIVPKLSYFEKCIGLIEDKKKLYITTDSPNHKNIKYLINKYDIKLIDLKRSETIKFASQFTTKILSTGTFSWWIGFLGNQNSKIYCPISNEYDVWLGDIYIFNNWNYISYKTDKSSN